MALIELSEWDTNFFGFRVARLRTDKPEEVKEADDMCKNEHVRLLISRFDTANMGLSHELERYGSQLMDTVVRWRLNLAGVKATAVPGPATLRQSVPSDADRAGDIAREVFAGHFGHFHQDSRIDRANATEIYAQWARNSCLDKNLADMVLFAVLDGKIVGFVTHKIKGNVVQDILSGVSSEAQGKGIRYALAIGGTNWCKSLGVEYFDSDVHVNNYRMGKAFASAGFKVNESFYTFHKWFDEEK